MTAHLTRAFSRRKPTPDRSSTSQKGSQSDYARSGCCASMPRRLAQPVDAVAPFDASQDPLEHPTFCDWGSSAGITFMSLRPTDCEQAGPKASLGSQSCQVIGRSVAGAAELRSPSASRVLRVGLGQGVEHLAEVLENPEMPLTVIHDQAGVRQVL
jgi:hypothetical protein